MNIKIYQSKAELFQILSHPVRLQILDALRKQPACVCHLQILTQRPQAYVSQQLRVLRDAGLVVDEKDGQNVYYRLCDQHLDTLLGEVMGPAETAITLAECTCPKCTQVNS
jgi:DNA-binding transcriptional ArsR family regulator